MARMIDLLALSENDIKEHLRKGLLTVAVFGLGHVGLPLACAWLRAGAKVIGVAKTNKKVSIINKGENPLIDELSLTSIIRKYVMEKKFKATTNGEEAAKQAHVILIAVPTHVKWNKTGKPIDLSILVNVLRTVAKGLSKGKLVIVESTVPPGTTLNLAKPLLEKISGLKAEKDFGLAYSPERIMAGHALQDIEENYPKIVGAVGPRSLKAAKALYEVIAKKGVITLSSTTAAEFEKVAEGIYRDVNIALANELAKLAKLLNVDFEEVRRAANSQPYCHLHKPGIGVGGSCIPVYPYFALHVALKYNLDLTLTRIARMINETMPEYVANIAIKALEKAKIDIEKAKIGILGLAFRGNISDTRLTPVIDLVQHLESYGVRNIVIHDPYAQDNPTKYPLVRDIEKVVLSSDLIIIATDHNMYAEELPKLLSNTSKKLVIVDGRNVLQIRKVSRAKNVTYIRI